MAPTASQASSKPPAYPKNGEPEHRSPSKTRSRDPVRKSAADSGLKKRAQSEDVSTRARSQSRSAKSVSSTSNSSTAKASIEARDRYIRAAQRESQSAQSEEVSTRARSQSRSAKSVSSTSNSSITKASIEARDRYIRAAQRESQSHYLQNENLRLTGKSASSHGKTAGPLKAFPHGSITNGNDIEALESVSTENLMVDLNGNYSLAENPTLKNGRKYSSSEKLSTSGFPRPLPVFVKPDVAPLSLYTPKSERTVGNGSSSKQSVRSHRDLSSRRGESENPKIDDKPRKTSAKSSDSENQDISETLERISLHSTPTKAKSRSSSKSAFPDIELKGNSYANKPEPSETEKRNGSYQKFSEKSARLGVNGGGEVLGGRSPDSLLQTEGYDYSKDRTDAGVKSRSRRSSIAKINDFTNLSISSKSGNRTETFVINVNQNLENGNDYVDRDHKTNCDSTTKPSSYPRSETGKSGKAGVVGLQNLGNTCFMNSVLQCLSNTRLLRDYCLDRRYEKDVNRSSSSMRGKMINVYADLVTAMWRGSQSSVSPTEFKSEISSFAKQFVGYREQDAHEFLVYLLEALHEDVNRVREKRRRIIDSTDEVETISAAEKAKTSWKNYLTCDDSQINDIFVGQLKSTLRCPDCSYVSNTFEPFLALSLPLKKVKTRMSLLDCFKLFSQEEVLDYENQPRCANCRMQKSCTKQMSIHRFPKVLIIHLMRFKQGSSTKLTTEVSCPLRDLDLSEFASAESTPESSAPVYNLYAVSNHSGSLYSGHYTAYARNPDSQQWHLFNDRTSTSVSLPRLETGQPYLLFYERQDEST